MLPSASGYNIVQPLKEFPCGKLSAHNRGRFLGIAYHYFPPHMDKPHEKASHGFLLSDSGITNLGPAEKVWFTPRGEIYGQYLGDKSGKAYALQSDLETYLYTFKWRTVNRPLLPGKSFNER